MAFDTTDLDARDGIFAVTVRNGRKARAFEAQVRRVLTTSRNGSRRFSTTRATVMPFIR